MNIRLSDEEISTLKSSLKTLSADAELYLFGSRVDENKRGGDIDLLIVSSVLDIKDLRKIRLDFFEKFGEQKMDIVLDDGNFTKPFNLLIKKDAIRL